MDDKEAIKRLSDMQNKFAQSLVKQYRDKGSLSPAQWKWVYRLINSKQGRFTPPF
tara:strand:- start:1452 stop:1616 length:165 start_codon:yes stop_codon:yes gene_type:complete